MCSRPATAAAMKSFSLVSLVIVCMALSSLLNHGVVASTELEESCRQRGFDPLQLSCDTCEELLSKTNNNLFATCQECCQSYITLKGKPQRFDYAVLFYRESSEEIAGFVGESLEEIQTIKGPAKFQVIPLQSMFVASQIYWMDVPMLKKGNTEVKLKHCQSLAKESVIVEGWRKEDLKDMLLTLLNE